MALLISQVIEDSWKDWLTLNTPETKRVMAKQIALTASGFIRNSGGKIEDWLERFKDTPEVIQELKSLSYK